MVKPVEKTILENGIRIVSRKMSHVRSVSMGVWVNVGARDETRKTNGASHFIEHMIFKGTEKRSAFEIAAEMDAIGGNTNAFTGMEDTCYHGKVLDTHLPSLADILSDIFLNSVFDQEEMNRERAVILQEIGMQEDSPDDRVHLMTSAALYGDHALGRSILGAPENLAALDASALKDHLTKWYQPDRIIITAAGHVEHEELVRMMSPAFEAVQPGEILPVRKPPQPSPKADYEHRDLEQVHMCLAMPGICCTDPRRFAHSILNALLGGNMSSRLFQEIREQRGLAYSVYSFAPSYSDAGAFGVYAGVDPDNVETTLDLILKILKEFKDKEISEKELHAAKEYILGSVFMSAESSDSQMLRLAQNEIHFGRYVPLEEVAKNVDSVTCSQVRELAAELMASDIAMAMVGPVKDPDSICRLHKA